MTLDLILVAVVMAFGLLGWLSGFWMQVMRLGVLVVSYLLAGLIGSFMGMSIARSLGIPILLGDVAGSFLAFIGLYMILSTIGWRLMRGIRRKTANTAGLRFLNSAAGAGFGMLKAGFILFMLLNAAVLLEGHFGQKMKNSELGYDKSVLVRVARKHNIIESMHLPMVGNVEALGRLGSDPAFRRKVANDPNIRALLAHPKIKRLLGDRALVSASRSRDFSALMSNPRLNEALEDPEVQKLVDKIDLSKLK